MIIKIEPSKKKFKRYRITMDDNKTYDFGLKNGNTYIEHHNKIIRENYRKRHYSNKTEKVLIDNLVPSPSLFSYYILWGPYYDINKNIVYLNNLWYNKYNGKIS
jgi:hypothetical protein